MEPLSQFPEEQRRRVDERLKQLIKVLQSQAGSNEKAHAIEQLGRMLPSLPGFKRSSHPYYLEAVNQTIEYIRRNIGKFKFNDNDVPGVVREKFVTWVNGYLYWRIRDLFIKQLPKDPEENPLSLDALIGGEEGGETWIDKLPADQSTRISPEDFDAPRLSDLDIKISPDIDLKRLRLGLALEQYIDEDPYKKLQSRYCKKCAACNCQALAQEVLLSDQGEKVTFKDGNKEVTFEKEKKLSFRMLAEKFGVPEPALRAHWNRICLPLLREITKVDLKQHEKDLFGE